MERCLVMGIANVTPDSFSDGGELSRPEDAVRRILEMQTQGADIIDIGAESTRPGATPVSAAEERERLEPVFAALPRGLRISIDTYRPETARFALESGASIVNCVSAAPLAEMCALCLEYGAELVFPASALEEFRALAVRGAAPERWYIDPMVGFGTTRDEDLSLLRSTPTLARLGRTLVGASRKRIAQKIAGVSSPRQTLWTDVGIAVWCALNGASCVRVHDVAEVAGALRAAWTLAGGKEL